MQRPPERMQDLYLGRLLDPETLKPTEQPYMYRTDDLTTHAMVVGMTGSGKTGLCLALLEEAALDGLPAILIDPKGDIANLLLQFPNMLPADFAPWVNPDVARRQNKTVEEAAAEAAATWRKGLAEWGIDGERIQGLIDSVQFTVYTPGSEAGYPVSIMTSLRAPQEDWNVSREVLREQISSTVTALLGIIGLADADPVTSREHILLSNIFEHNWSQGQDLDLGTIILQVQNPPFNNLGVFDIEQFFSQKDRFGLAMRLNNILAAPSFQSWLNGEPLDIDALLHAPDGRPRQSIFYIAHLPENERMFIVTLLLSALESWMRRQAGTNSLRALLYFDEIFGYVPPVRNAPSKQILLRLLKQARAFGLGLLLATQNPGDLDYKALSNAGTWFVGRLQTEVDKNRLLDGLAGAAQAAGASLDRGEVDRLISKLGRRMFLAKNVHHGAPVVFSTRWVQSFLAGPLRREQVRTLNAMHANPEMQATEGVGAGPEPTPAVLEPAVWSPPPGLDEPPPADASSGFFAPVNPAVALGQTGPNEYAPQSYTPPQGVRRGGVTAQTGQTGQTGRTGGTGSARRGGVGPTNGDAGIPGYSRQRINPPLKMQEFYLPRLTSTAAALLTINRSIDDSSVQVIGAGYRPGLLGQARVRFTNRRNTVNEERTFAGFVSALGGFGTMPWSEHQIEPIPARVLLAAPEPDMLFGDLNLNVPAGRTLRMLQDELIDHIFSTMRVTWPANTTLGLEANSDESRADFRARCEQAAEEQEAVEAARVDQKFQRQLLQLSNKLEREKRELAEEESELKGRQLEETTRYGEMLLNIFTRRRHSMDLTASMAVRRRKQQAEANIQESRAAITQFERQLNELEDQLEQELQVLDRKWAEIAGEITTVTLAPLKKNTIIELFGVLWWPHWLVNVDGRMFELPAYSAGDA